MHQWRVTTEPSVEPVTLAEAKLQLRLDTDDEDALVSSLITTARITAEAMLHQSLVTRTITLVMDSFPSGGEIILPSPPVASVTSIAYIDTDGATQTWGASNYKLSAGGRLRASIVRAYDVAWPETRAEADAVTVVYVAGYGLAASVPAVYKDAIKLLVATWFENRESVVLGTIATELPMSAKALLAPHKAMDFRF